MPSKSPPKRKLIRYAGYDPTERNALATHKKPGRATIERDPNAPKRSHKKKPLGAYERRIKDDKSNIHSD